jgi:lysophospholipase L1-like esterase
VRYAAIGDSFTEGIGDELPDGSPRGWADLVAAGLAGSLAEPVQYANLAVRGRLMNSIVTGQLDQALALSPTLLTLNGGGNDMMRPGADVHRLADLTDRAVRRCVESGVRIVLVSAADPSQRLPLGKVVHRRAAALCEAVAELAERYGVEFVDVFADQELRGAGYWSPDRLHLGPAGHRRVADLVLNTLGVSSPCHVIEQAPAEPRRPWTEVRYYREHVLPWMIRHLQGRSTGRDLDPKHRDWALVRVTT